MEEKPCAKEKREMEETLLEYLLAPIGYLPPSHQPLDPEKDITPIEVSTELFDQLQQAQEKKADLWEKYQEKWNIYNQCRKQKGK